MSHFTSFWPTQACTIPECEGFNSAISPRRPPARPANTSQEDFTLGLTAKKRLRDRCIKSYTKYCVSFALTWDVSTNAAKSICPAVLLIRSQPQRGAVRVRYAIGGITRISCRCIEAVWSPFSSGWLSPPNSPLLSTGRYRYPCCSWRAATGRRFSSTNRRRQLLKPMLILCTYRWQRRESYKYRTVLMESGGCLDI